MRWIVVLLLVANLVVFGWYRYGSVAGTTSIQSSAPIPAGEALRLLNEMGMKDGRDQSDEHPSIESPAVATAPATKMCGSIGAFREQVSAKQVRDRLLALGAVADIVEIPVESRTDYWVHMGPYPSRERAMVVLRELQKKGVDSFLIADGELANGVSLGLFRQRASAEALMAERKLQGYEVALREIPRVALERWVVIKEGSEVAEPVRNQLLAVSPGTEYRKNPCGSIVNVNKFE